MKKLLAISSIGIVFGILLTGCGSSNSTPIQNVSQATQNTSQDDMIEMEDHSNDLNDDGKKQIKDLAYELSQTGCEGKNEDEWFDELINIQKQYGFNYMNNYAIDVSSKRQYSEIQDEYDINNPSLLDQAIMAYEYLPDAYENNTEEYIWELERYPDYKTFYKSTANSIRMKVRLHFVSDFKKQHGVSWYQFEVKHSVNKPFNKDDVYKN